MTIKIIQQVGNTCASASRPIGYVTYLVECDCGERYLILKKNFNENKHCKKCVNRIIAQKKTLPIELRKKQPPKRHQHHMKGTHFYKKRMAIKGRCNYKCVNGYKNYGGRGIKCEWKTFEEFRDDMYESYLEHVEQYGEKDTTIDRINSNGNYCKENCRWLTMKEQQSTKRCNIQCVYKGKIYSSLKSLCDEKLLPYRSIFGRIQRGWSIDKAIETPI